jgi:uncharacterized integral membrane protein
LIGAWIVQDNGAEITIVLLGFQLGALPVGLWLLIFFFGGLLIGQSIVYPMTFNLKRLSRRDAKLISKLKSELLEMQQKSNVDST